jgi:uncharacterized membrane protein YgdD (TMEM256/DUF423 family)
LKTLSNLIFLVAALQGAGGVVLAAAAAHLSTSGSVAVASQMLMIHAGAGIGLASLSRQGVPRVAWFAVAVFVLQLSVTLFSLDLVSRSFLETRLFPYAAPIGGSLTIFSWLALGGWSFAGLISGAAERR